MNADERRCPDSLTEQVLSETFEVSNTLGPGFLEKVYEHAPFKVTYEGHPALPCLIGVHRRSSAAKKGFENSRPLTPYRYWPPMNADERRCPDSLTEQVLSETFEVSNTLGPGFLEKVYERAPFKVTYEGHPALPCLIGVHRRSSAANKGFENSRPLAPHRYWPPMNADERRCPDSLTEQVLSETFEVSNTLGPGFLEKVYEHAPFKVTYEGHPALPCLIGVHRRSSAANKGFENSRPLAPHRYWPPMNADERRCPDSLTEQVLSAIFEVSNTLGPGFLEKVYERALLKELTFRGIRAKPQASFTVTYKGHPVGQYFADILVEDALVIELKCVDRLANEHTAQCLNYLKASGTTVCLLVNFQNAKVDWRRIVNGFEA